MKNYIEKYISNKRKSLYNIILYYNQAVLNVYDEEYKVNKKIKLIR